MVDDNDLVMRSVYLRPTVDSELRQLAHELKVTKSDLIRSAVGIKLKEWLDSNDQEKILEDLAEGRRESATERAAKAAAVKPQRQPRSIRSPKSAAAG